MVKLESYNQNAGNNANKVIINGLTLFFLYNTIVALRNKEGLFVHENIWRQTTGKHLNWIDGGDKKSRLNEEDFKKVLDKCLNNIK